MQVLDAVMRYSDRNAGEEYVGQQVEVLHWAAAIDDTGVLCTTSTLSPHARLSCD